MCDFIKNSKKLLMEVVCFSFPRQALHQLTTIPTQVSNILLVLFWRSYSPCISPPFIFFCAHLHTWRFSGPLLQRSTEYIDGCMYICSIRNTGSTGLQVWWRKNPWMASSIKRCISTAQRLCWKTCWDKNIPCEPSYLISFLSELCFSSKLQILFQSLTLH